VDGEALLRLSIFVGVLAVLAVAERLWPRRTLAFGRTRRWFTNLGLSVFNTAMLRVSFLLVPALSVLAAFYVEGRGVGVLPALGVSGWFAVFAAFLVLDLAIYAQHVAFHLVPPFWRLHRAHHADPDFDVTTAVRFHPLEILISQAWKIAVVLALGAPVIAVVAFEIALNATSMFSHANLRLPLAVDSAVRAIFVTPDMHRIHHSIHMAETNSNFGFNLSIWDRLFGTYRAEPADGHLDMAIGLQSYRNDDPTRFAWLLRFPFLKGPAA
jgi:sterol desaturase/sphingolipid hydroxylase (fatty acid hydroxylase superfamily)